MNVKRGRTSLPGAFKFAFSGIVETAKNERTFRIELIIGVLALIASALLQLQPIEWALIIVLIVLVLVLELINSALERLVDLATHDEHPLAKYTKDAAAAAVLVASIGAAIVGAIIFVFAALRLWGG